MSGGPARSMTCSGLSLLAMPENPLRLGPAQVTRSFRPRPWPLGELSAGRMGGGWQQDDHLIAIARAGASEATIRVAFTTPFYYARRLYPIVLLP